jgi:phosphomannomutase/phosphoglucomutase
MKKEQAIMAGEMSGHFFFADRYFGYDDGLYAALRTIEIIANTGKTVVELLADLPEPFSTPELRLDCGDDVKFEVVERVHQHYRNSGAQVIDIDGVRVVYPDGSWGLVRASNTSPKLVLRFEGPTQARVAELRQSMEAVIAQAKAG